MAPVSLPGCKHKDITHHKTAVNGTFPMALALFLLLQAKIVKKRPKLLLQKDYAPVFFIIIVLPTKPLFKEASFFGPSRD